MSHHLNPIPHQKHFQSTLTLYPPLTFDCQLCDGPVFCLN
jgi:hypothetical protein